jgi:hypothetical protein
VLDCGRIAEAAVCGAVPVIVGAAAEVDGAFRGWAEGLPDPPWLFFESWAAAAEGMAALYAPAARPALLARQEAVVGWWRTAVRYWRDEIARALGPSGGGQLGGEEWECGTRVGQT